ncbi:MAG: glycosyltransferase [Bacilli bacterium]|nr:glycosyltransferase [Bacilli bacterium]
MKKESKKELSIIIPCYNSEKYIVKCLNSLKKQLQNINHEIIIVDDCSQDNTVNVIKEYINNNILNIIFLQNENNKGAGYSRNKAIKIAKFDYISFIDSDDYLDDNYYETLLNILYTNNLDVVVCDINCVYEDQTPSVIGEGCCGKVSNINIINTGFAASPCNKIIRKNLLEKYPFAEGIMNEDIASIIAIIANCERIGYTNKTKYNYVQHSSSVQNSGLSDKRFDIFKSIELLEKRIRDNENHDKIMKIICYQQLFLFFIYVIPREKKLLKRTKFLRKFNRMSKKYNLKQNNLCFENLERRGKKASFYYKLLFYLNYYGFSFLTSLIISAYNSYHKFKYSSFIVNKKSVIKKNIDIKDLINVAKKQSKMHDNKIKLTAIIPNYNYEKFMYQRVYSILNQDYKIDELIILDDCSKDNSRELIDCIVDNLKEYINIKKIYNEKNSGSPFKQWKKGFDNASGDYVWIAEADDYCENNMVSCLMNTIKRNNDIVLSYVDTAFVDEFGVVRVKSIKPEIDIQKTNHWNKDFINDGVDEIKNYCYLNCTIANVSSVIFKNGDYDQYFKISSEFKQAGDWLFYVNVIKNGNISFINKPLNYYRVHGNNVTSTTKKEMHLEEIKKIHKIINDEFNLNDTCHDNMKKRIEFLKKVWDLNK